MSNQENYLWQILQTKGQDPQYMKYCYFVIRKKLVPRKNNGQNIQIGNSQKEMQITMKYILKGLLSPVIQEISSKNNGIKFFLSNQPRSQNVKMEIGSVA